MRPETQRAYIQLNIAPGDRGVLKFCDKSIEEYRKGNENYNGDDRTHSISDGIFQLGFCQAMKNLYFRMEKLSLDLKQPIYLSVNETGDFTIKAKAL